MFKSSFLMASLPAVLLCACVVAPYPPAHQAAYYGPAPIPAPVVVDIAPPAPHVEAVPAIPYAGAVWIGGYWGWAGGRHQWVPGRWEQPRPGYTWRPYAWAQHGGRWHLHEGCWVRG